MSSSGQPGWAIAVQFFQGFGTVPGLHKSVEAAAVIEKSMKLVPESLIVIDDKHRRHVSSVLSMPLRTEKISPAIYSTDVSGCSCLLQCEQVGTLFFQRPLEVEHRKGSGLTILDCTPDTR